MTVAGISIPHIAQAPGSSLTVSIGISTVTPGVGSDNRQLTQEADKELYAAKHDGRNQIAVSWGRTSVRPQVTVYGCIA